MISKEQFEELGFKHREEFFNNERNISQWKTCFGLWLIDEPMNELFIEYVKEKEKLTEEQWINKIKEDYGKSSKTKCKSKLDKWFDNNQVNFEKYDRFYSGNFPYHIVYNEKLNRLAVLYSAHTGARGVIFEGWCETQEDLKQVIRLLRI